MSGPGVRRLPGDWPHTADAEAAVDVPAGEVGCTHFAGGRVVVTVTGEPADPTPGTDPVVVAHESATGGRVFAFPGQHDLETADGVLTAQDVVRLSAVDAVVRLGGVDVAPREPVDPRGFVRPRLHAGRLELVVRPAVGGLLVPFEQRDQIACCADH